MATRANELAKAANVGSGPGIYRPAMACIHLKPDTKTALLPAWATLLALAAVALAACSSDDDSSAPGEVSILIRGAPIKGANGIRFDAQDRLHVASVFGREVVVMDPNDGTILDRVTFEDGIEGPDDLAFGPDGSLYWTSIVTGAVGRRWTDGSTLTVAQLPPGPNPIAMSADGRLLVGLCFFGDGLYEVDPDGTEAPRKIAENLGGGCGFNGFDFGPDGYLYAPGFFRDEIMRVDIDTAEMEKVASGFGVPNALKFDRQGRLHQIDTQRGQIWQVDTETGAKDLVADIPSNTDNLDFDSSNRLFISAADSGQIAEVLADGSLRVVSPGGIATPGGIARIGDSLYIADHYSLVEVDRVTGAAVSTETAVIGVSQLAEPLTVSADGDMLILSSYLRNAVQVWNPHTNSAVVTYEDFAVPMNAIAFRGGIAVAELGLNRVSWQPDGAGQPRQAILEGLAVPTGMAADGDRLYAADWARGTVTVVEPDGTSNVIADGLDRPEGLALTPAGHLLVVEAGAGRLTRVRTDTGQREVVAEGLALGAAGIATDHLPPTWLFNGVTVDDEATAYVTGDIDNVVYRIAR